jgi:hypothetical protein
VGVSHPGAKQQGDIMDLQVYYQKLRQTENLLSSEQTYIVSLATADGGKAGVITQTPTLIAARMIVEGSARTADPEEIAQFEKAQLEARQRAEQLAEASKLRVVLQAAAPPPPQAAPLQPALPAPEKEEK